MTITDKGVTFEIPQFKFSIVCSHGKIPYADTDAELVGVGMGRKLILRFQGRESEVVRFNTGLNGSVLTIETADGGYFYTNIPSRVWDLCGGR